MAFLGRNTIYLPSEDTQYTVDELTGFNWKSEKHAFY